MSGDVRRRVSILFSVPWSTTCHGSSETDPCIVLTVTRLSDDKLSSRQEIVRPFPSSNARLVRGLYRYSLESISGRIVLCFSVLAGSTARERSWHTWRERSLYKSNLRSSAYSHTALLWTSGWVEPPCSTYTHQQVICRIYLGVESRQVSAPGHPTLTPYHHPNVEPNEHKAIDRKIVDTRCLKIFAQLLKGGRGPCGSAANGTGGGIP